MKRFIQISIVVIISSVLLVISYSLEDYSYEPNDNRLLFTIGHKKNAFISTTNENELGDTQTDDSIKEEKETATPKKYNKDFSSQLQLIADNFSFWTEDYYQELDYCESPKVAIADLNHNGRLELLITDCQGSGAYSYTAIYEIKWDYTTVERMTVDNYFDIDNKGDFYTTEFDCYKKDDIYYYVIEDYYSEGFSFKSEDFYSYCFDDGVEKDLVAGFKLSPVSYYEQKSVYVGWYDSSKLSLQNEKQYYEIIEEYWKGYEKQPTCAIKWIPLPEEENCISALKESYENYNPDSEQKEVTKYNYKECFDFFGEETTYICWPLKDNISIYESFLKNESKVYVSKNNNMGRYADIKSLEEKNVTLEELVNGLIDYTLEKYSSKIKIDTVDYAFIDCGKDSVPDLALNVTIATTGEAWSTLIIIQEISGRLETVYSNDSWSRCYRKINQYGYIAEDGSGGASSHGFSKEYVDGKGNWHFVYYNDAEYRAPNDELKEMGLEDNYVYFKFYFDDPDKDYENYYFSYAFFEEKYDFDINYFKNFCYTSITYNDSIFEDSHPLKKYYSEHEEEVYNLNDIKKMISKKEKEEGVTEDIKNGEEADWRKLKITFTPNISVYNDDNFLGIKEYFDLSFSLINESVEDSTYIKIHSDGSMEGSYWHNNDRYEFTGKFEVVSKDGEGSITIRLTEFDMIDIGDNPPAFKYIPKDFVLYCKGTKMTVVDAEAMKQLDDDYFMNKYYKHNRLKEYLLIEKGGNKSVWYESPRF